MKIKESIQKLEEERKRIDRYRSKIAPIFLLIPFTIIASMVAKLQGPSLIFINLMAVIIVIGIYQFAVAQPFRDLVADFKSKLVDHYMKNYHPDMLYQYQAGKKDVRRFIRESKLIRPNSYKEEDVLTGSFRGINFYISEVDLKRKSNNSVRRLLKGMLFRIQIPGRSFPDSLIQSKVGMIKRHFHNFVDHPEYNFQYSTESDRLFNEELGGVLPFIQHLVKSQGDVRVETKGDEILILIESKENFLDSPKANLQNSFERDDHYSNLVRQINSFLYIVETFSSELESSEIEKELELKVLDLLEREDLL